MRTPIFLIALAISTSIAFAEQADILIQAGSPLQIESYRNYYKNPDRFGDGSIMHMVTLKNVSDQPVEGYGLGFFAFDSFNRSLGRPFVGYSMSPVASEAQDNPSWEHKPLSAFLFDGNGRALAYIDIVRLKDGTIWKANMNEINAQLRDYELNLDETVGSQ